jgi:hypothetical protein
VATCAHGIVQSILEAALYSAQRLRSETCLIDPRAESCIQGYLPAWDHGIQTRQVAAAGGLCLAGGRPRITPPSICLSMRGYYDGKAKFHCSVSDAVSSIILHIIWIMMQLCLTCHAAVPICLLHRWCPFFSLETRLGDPEDREAAICRIHMPNCS